MKVNIAGRPLDPSLCVGVGVVLAGVLIYYLVDFVSGRASLARKRVRKRQERDQALSALANTLQQNKPPNEQCDEILSLDILHLREKLQAGDLHPTDVLMAYQDKALEVHKKINCIVEPLVEAEEYAQQLAASGDKKGLLYGIPVSLKDQFPVKGYDSTIGCANWIDRPFADDSVMVKLLKAEGAVPFVKTNVPQTMLSTETTNPIYGCTKNPQDTSRSAGGSTGGEGALIAAGGSLLGLGSDVGGSIRVPCSMNGICGLKPTAGRISHIGDHPFLSGLRAVPVSYGPMSPDVAGCALMMKVLCGPKVSELDPGIPRLLFNDEIYNSRNKLKIGYFVNEAYCEAVPAMQRGVLEAKAKLEALGHEVIPWRLPIENNELAKYYCMALFDDGGKAVTDMMAYDTSDAAMVMMRPLLSLPVIVRKIIGTLIYPIDKNASRMANWTCGVQNASEMHEVNTSISDMRTRVFKSWQQNKLDAVISPAFACPPLPCGQISLATRSIPVTKVTADDVTKMADYPTPDIGHKTIKKGMKGTEGLVVNVQVATLPWQEEMCLRVMKELEDAVDVK